MNKRIKALFSGSVQGVGFRYTARGIAKRFAVAGYVKNLPNGQVELIAEGDEREVQNFITAVCRSELSEYIRQVDTDWQASTGEFSVFDIRF